MEITRETTLGEIVNFFAVDDEVVEDEEVEEYEEEGEEEDEA